MERQRDGIGAAGDEVGSRPGGFDAGRERVAADTLEVDADGQAASLREAAHEVARTMWLERAGRVVEQDPGRAQLRQAARLLQERLRLACASGAVHEARV